MVSMDRRKYLINNVLRMTFICIGAGLMGMTSAQADVQFFNPIFIFIALAVVVGNCIPLFFGSIQITQAFAFEYLALMILGPVNAAWISVIGIIGQGIATKQRKVEWYLLNSSIHSLSVLGAGYVFLSLGGKYLVTSGVYQLNPAFLLPVFGGAIAHFIFNIGMVYPIIMVQSPTPVNHAKMWNVLSWDFIAKLIFAPLAYYFYIVFYHSTVDELIPPVVFLFVMWIFIRKSMELATTKRELNEKIIRIEEQKKISHLAHESLDLKQVVETIAENARRMYKCEISMVHIADNGMTLDTPLAVAGRTPDNLDEIVKDEKFKECINKVHRSGEHFLSSDDEILDLLLDCKGSEKGENSRQGTVAIYPLIASDEKIGTITLVGKYKDHFSDLNKEMIEFIALELSGAVQNARIYERLKYENNERNEELSYAATIQSGILPSDYMSERVKIGTCFTPARYLGGDFYEISPRMDGQIAIAVGDVSGKGVPAALTMMSIISLLKRMCHEPHGTKVILDKLNKELDWESSEAESDTTQYATCFFILFDPNSGHTRYSNAGHVRPYLFRKKTRELIPLKGGGFPLGMFPHGNFNESEVFLELGDKIILYTDGATDVENSKSQRLGNAGFEKLVREICEEDKIDIAKGINDGIMQFKEDSRLADDVAIVTIEYMGGPIDELAEISARAERGSCVD
jgi:serine phosphatase RsbU (regulator of sigma subunit)